MGTDFGSHISTIYQNKEQQFAQVVPFIIEGLNNNNKCIYVVDDNTREEVIFELTKTNLDINKFLQIKQLEILTTKDTYLKDSVFEPYKLLNLIKQLEKNAIKDGFTGLRGMGEMTWVLNNPSDNKKLLDYELELNILTKDRKIILLCQYNENRFSHEILNNIIRTHRQLFIYGKYYENKYLYTDPAYLKIQPGSVPSDSYKSMIDIIIDG